MKKIICIIVVSSILATCCFASEKNFGCYDYDNPFNLNFDERPELVIPTNSSYKPSFINVTGLSGKELAIYENPYASGDTEDLKTIDYYYSVDGKLIEQSRKTLIDYLAILGLKHNDSDIVIDNSAGSALVVDEEYTVKATGNMLKVYGYSVRNASFETLDSVKTNKYFKAAVNMLGFGENAVYASRVVGGNAEVRVYYSMSDADIYSEPSKLVLRYNGSNEKGDFFLTIYLCDFLKYKTEAKKAVSYENALKKLKEHECYGIFMFDENLNYDDIMCDFVYTDLINRYCLIPCYKFYVRVLHDDKQSGVELDKEHKYYNVYYVPAVDMNANPQTSDMPVVSAILLGTASLSGLAVAFYCNKRKKMKKISKYT